MPVNSFRDAPLITVTKTESVSATPQKVAEMFLAMDSVQQADFFDALGKLVQEEYSRNKKLYAFGEMQWCYMAGELKQRQGVGWNTYLALSAFAYHWFEQKPQDYSVMWGTD